MAACWWRWRWRRGDDDDGLSAARAQAPAPQPPPPPPAVKVGQAMPDFTLPYMSPKAGGGYENKDDEAQRLQGEAERGAGVLPRGVLARLHERRCRSITRRPAQFNAVEHGDFRRQRGQHLGEQGVSRTDWRGIPDPERLEEGRVAPARHPRREDGLRAPHDVRRSTRRASCRRSISRRTRWIRRAWSGCAKSCRRAANSQRQAGRISKTVIFD